MGPTAVFSQYNSASKSISGVVITKKIVSDCVNIYDIFVITLGSLISHLVYLGQFSDDSGEIIRFSLYGLVGALVASRAFHWARVYAIRNLTRLRWQLSHVSVGWLAIMVGGLTIAFLAKSSADISRGWFLLWFSGALFWLVAGRLVVARLLHGWTRQGRFLRRVALVTIESEKAAAWAGSKAPTRILSPLPEFFSVDEIGKLIADSEIDEVIVALPAAERHRLAEVVAYLSAMPIDVSVSIDLPLPATTIRHFEVQGNELLARVSERPLQNWNALHKRLLDLAIRAS